MPTELDSSIISLKRNPARGFGAALGVTLGFWAVVLFWLGSQSDPFWSGYKYRAVPTDYYNVLVDGFLSGHLSMKAQVDPDLLSPDPQTRNRASYLLDAALYGDRYYLYYGVTPAAVLLYPYALVTGRHVSPPAACLIFSLVGLGTGAYWLRSFRNRFLPGAGAIFAATGISILAIVPGTAFLVRRSSFYDLPIAAGYMWMSLFWLALWNSFSGRKPLLWIALASASFGMAVGCRINLVLIGPVLVAVPWMQGRLSKRVTWAAWLSLVAPAGSICALLGAYNYARFGNPTDFGFSHGLNSFFGSGKLLLSLRFVASNAKAYLLDPPSLAVWFPFIFPSDSGPCPALYGNAEAMCGFLPVTVLAGWILATGFGAPPIQGSRGAPIARWILLLGAATALEAVFMFLLGIRAYRYATDFLTPVSLLMVLGLARSWGNDGGFGRFARSGAVVLVFLACIQVVLGAIQLFGDFAGTRKTEYARLQRLFSPKQSTLERFGAPKPGGVKMSVRFFRPETATIVPVLSTGVPSEYDSIRAIVFPNGYVKFEILHSGYGGPSTELIPVDWNHPYALEAFMGSLYPAEMDPFFAAWPPQNRERVKSLGWLRFNGNTVIEREMAFFEGSGRPDVVVGSRRNNEPVVVESIAFGLPMPTGLVNSKDQSAAVYALQLALPEARKTRPLPLISSGVTGAGDLLYFDPLPDGRYRLGVDEWGIGGIFGDPFSPKVGKLAAVQVVVGPALRFDSRFSDFLKSKDPNHLDRRIMVWYESQLVGNFVIENHLETFGNLQLARNDAGFTSAVSAFSGELKQVELSQDEQIELLARAEQLAGAGSR